MRTLPTKFQRNLLFGISLLGLLYLGGCGNATNNDQGVAFSLMGFFAEFPEGDGCDSLPTGQLGAIVPLNNPPDEILEESGGEFSIVGIENHLTQVAIRTDRVFLEYFIPGSDRQPPSTNQILSVQVDPAVADTSAGGVTSPFDSSLPPSYGGQGCARNFASIIVLPPDIREWINFNRSALPEAPFSMEVTAAVTGLSTAGDRYTTNEAKFTVLFTPDVVITPTDGSGSGGEEEEEEGEE